MYTRYYAPSTASTAVHWMLIDLGVPFALALVDFETWAQRSAAYLALNPSGHVPTLMIDGRAYAECAALLMLLAERHPDANLSPAPDALERADYLQLMFYFANTLQPVFRAWFYPHEPAGPAHVEAVQAQARARIEAAWGRIDARLADGRPYMLGERRSAADFLGTILTRWSRDMPRPATAWPHLKAYVDRMRATPSLQEVHRREGLTDWIGG